MNRFGIISGMAEELAAFMPECPGVIVRHRAMPVRYIEAGGKELFLLSAGIGKVAAATAATLLSEAYAVEMLFVIGTAGVIGEVEGNLFNIVSAVQADYGAQRSDGFVHYTAGALPIGDAVVTAFDAMGLPHIGLPGARIATGDLFIECGIHAERLRSSLGTKLVDMETAAVAQCARLLGLPWAAIKAVTDGADEASSHSFAANLAAAARSSALAAEKAIALL